MDLMRCDPGSLYALDGLLSWHSRSSLAPEVLLEGLLLHLDSLNEGATVGTAWSALASLLEHAALQAFACMSQQDRGAASSMQHMQDELGDPEVNTEQDDSEQYEGNLGTVAWEQWGRIQKVLSSRKSWWPAMHFSVQPRYDWHSSCFVVASAVTVCDESALCRSSWLKDDPALADKAVCAAFIMGCQAGYCKAAARALHKGGDLDGARRIERSVGVVDAMLRAGFLHKDALQGSDLPTGARLSRCHQGCCLFAYGML